MPDTARAKGSAAAAIVRGAAGAYGVQLCGALLAFGAQIVLARCLGEVGYGAFVFAISWLTILQVVAVLGLDRTTLRFGAVYRGQGDWAALRGLLRTATFAIGAASLMLGLALGGAGYALAGEANRSLGLTLLIAGAVLPLMGFSLLRVSVLQAFRRVVVAQLPEQILRPLLLAVGVAGLFALYGGQISSASAMAINFGAMAIAVAVGAYFVRRTLPTESRHAAPAYASRLWFTTALPLMAIAALHVANKKMDVLFVGSILGEGEAGIYGAASRLTDLLAFGIAAVNAMVSPAIAEAFAKGDGAAMNRTLRVAAWGTLGFTLPAAGALFVAGPFALSLFGPGFGAAFPALAIILAGQVVNAATGPVAAVMTMTGRQKAAAAITFAAFLGNLALNAVLVPQFGILGAAAATAITAALMNLAMLGYCLSVLKLNPTVAAWRR